MSGMEIALEGILDELQEALQNSSRDGVRELLPMMRDNSEDIRERLRRKDMTRKMPLTVGGPKSLNV
jgi:hypothetical protein